MATNGKGGRKPPVSAKAVASYLRRMRRGDATVEGLQELLAARRRKRVSVEDAQKLFDRTTAKWRAQAAARKRAHRARRADDGKCTRCGDRARIGTHGESLSTCEPCNNNSKDAMKAGRAQRRVR